MPTTSARRSMLFVPAATLADDREGRRQRRRRRLPRPRRLRSRRRRRPSRAATSSARFASLISARARAHRAHQRARHAVRLSRPGRRRRAPRAIASTSSCCQRRARIQRHRVRRHAAGADRAASRLERRIGIEAQIETAAGFLYAREIAQASPRLEALIFGPGDYAASMQMPSAVIGELDEHDELYPGHRWHAVMHTIVAAARANGLRAMDGPFAAFKDAAGFEHSCRIARAHGLRWQAVHSPVAVGRRPTRIFSPTAEEVAHAQRVVRGVRARRRQRTGAVSLDGTMIDAANIRMARVVLDKIANHGAQTSDTSGRCYEDFEVGTMIRASSWAGPSPRPTTPGSRC